MWSSWRPVCQLLKKLNVHVPCYPVIPLLDIYQREKMTHVHTKTCTWMLKAAFFVIGKNWKPHKRPRPGEWINKLSYIHTMEYYSAILGKE